MALPLFSFFQDIRADEAPVRHAAGAEIRVF